MHIHTQSCTRKRTLIRTTNTHMHTQHTPSSALVLLLSLGITEVRTASGLHSLSVGMDGTAQLFDPWGAWSPVAGSGGLKVLQSETVSLQNSLQPPKTLVKGVAVSGNGVYFATVCRYMCVCMPFACVCARACVLYVCFCIHVCAHAVV